MDKNTRQRIRRQATKNAATKKYEKTKKGFLMRTYRNMKSRVLGIQRLKAHLYLGLPILGKEEFYTWSLNNPAFNLLFEVWKSNNHDRKLTPSINRVNSNKGYLLNNIEWITHSENSRLGSLSRYYAVN